MVKKIMDETNKGFMKYLGGLNFKKIDEKYISRPSKYDTYVSEPRPRIDHLALMPSPYLNGLFDKIIKNCPYDLEGTIETTRVCPFGCTFCENGKK